VPLPSYRLFPRYEFVYNLLVEYQIYAGLEMGLDMGGHCPLIFRVLFLIKLLAVSSIPATVHVGTNS
jgi:hypothetical protein